jgi:hypothetical protein
MVVLVLASSLCSLLRVVAVVCSLVRAEVGGEPSPTTVDRLAGRAYGLDNRTCTPTPNSSVMHRWRAAERGHFAGGENMGSLTLQTLQEPILLLHLLSRLSKPSPGGFGFQRRR